MAKKLPLPTVTPEEAGVPSCAVRAFVERLNADGLCMHSFIMAKAGKVFAKGYWKPYDAEQKHRMYSISKSFTSIAIGLLVGEGKIKLGDKVIDFFPERAKTENPFLSRTTVRDLLMMADSHDTTTYELSDSDWIDTYFTKPSTHLPGTAFSYNTACTVMLSAIVERVSGQQMLDYMRPRILEPIGISDDIFCIKTPCGYSWGGSGIVCTPEDLLRFALVCANGGMHGTKRLIPADYISAAISRQIDNSVENSNIEFRFGYGYQIWRTRNNGFAFRGMGTQLALCLPEKDFVLVTTADTQGNPSGDLCVYKSLWEEIYPHLDGEKLAPNDKAYEELMHLTSTLSIPLPEGRRKSPLAVNISGKPYQMTPNAMGITDTEFIFDDSKGEIRYTNELGAQRIKFGFGYYIEQPFTQTNYSGRQIGTPSGVGYRTFASAAWADEKTLIIQVYLADDYLGNMRMSACFNGREVTLHISKTAENFLDEYPGFASGETEN